MNSFRIMFFGLLAVFLMNSDIAADDFSCPFPTVKRCKDGTSNFSYAADNPQEVSRNQSVIVKVTGGMPPYKWIVIGQGFSLGGPSETNEPENRVVADTTACGSADIKVYDKCEETKGSIRCPDGGVWVSIRPAVCIISEGQLTRVYDKNRICHQTRINGKYKLYQPFIIYPSSFGFHKTYSSCEAARIFYANRDVSDPRCEKMSPPHSTAVRNVFPHH